MYGIQCHQAARLSSNKNKVTVEDFKYVLQHDNKKLARVEELIRMSEDIKAARKIVNMPEFDTLNEGNTASKSTRLSSGGGVFSL